MMRNFQRLLRASGRLEATAYEQIQRLGYDPAEVRHIVLTHLHLDHAGGLPDFPEAQIHIYRPEYEAAMKTARGFWELFLRPEHWAHGPHWVLHDRESGIGNDEVERKTWYGFEAILLEGISPRVALIPLTGHTPGHCGVAVETLSGWVLHCGDALPYGGPVNVPPEWFSSLLIGDHGPRLRALAREHGDEVLLLSAHLPPAWMAALQRGERPY
jgi:glyoxylase-like metal-dependent hydrolase (beta-lactamase superfamily II)